MHLKQKQNVFELIISIKFVCNFFFLSWSDFIDDVIIYHVGFRW